jgi:hypothetical protein
MRRLLLLQVVLVKRCVAASGHQEWWDRMMAMLQIIQIITKRLCFADLRRLVVYDNVLTFSVDGGALKYKLDNGGSTFSQFLQNVVVEQ